MSIIIWEEAWKMRLSQDGDKGQGCSQWSERRRAENQARGEFWPWEMVWNGNGVAGWGGFLWCCSPTGRLGRDPHTRENWAKRLVPATNQGCLPSWNLTEQCHHKFNFHHDPKCPETLIFYLGGFTELTMTKKHHALLLFIRNLIDKAIYFLQRQMNTVTLIRSPTASVHEPDSEHSIWGRTVVPANTGAAQGARAASPQRRPQWGTHDEYSWQRQYAGSLDPKGEH